MIIDVANNLGEPWGTPYNQTADELLRRMDRSGVDIAVVSSFPFGNFDNDYVAQAVERHPDRLVGFVTVSPFAEETPDRVIERYVDNLGFKGVRLHPAAHGYKFIERAVSSTIFEECAARPGLPVLTYSGDELYATPLQVMIAAEDYPTVPIIMQHSGFMMQSADAFTVAERCPNVYLEHSSGYTLAISQSLESAGADRVVFGTDTPTEDYEVSLYMHKLAIPDPVVLDKVLGLNAAKLLGLAG